MENLALFVGEKIKAFRKNKRMTQQVLADRLGVSKQTISRYEGGSRKPDQDTLFQLADVFGVSIDDFFPPIGNPTPATEPNPSKNDGLTATIDKLTDSNRQKVENYAINLLDQQSQSTVEEPQPLYEVRAVSRLAAGYGYGYDDADIKIRYVEDEPPRHDIASLVDGNSMLPDYEHDDVVYLVDRGFSRFSGQVCAVVIDDETFIKKVYTEPNGLRLVSINPAYPDKFVGFPPAGDSHIKIFSVVGSATPVEK